MHSYEPSEVEGQRIALSLPNPVCILGTHRCGGTDLARILNGCGLSLGEPPDIVPPRDWGNRDGSFENRRFSHLNNEILETVSLDGAPQLDAGWSRDFRLSGFKSRAKELAASAAGLGEWGWKDPRTMLTLEFWQSVMPKMRAILVVRHPLDTALSLSKRPLDNQYLGLKDSIDLWLGSHRIMRQSLDLRDCLVVNYESLRSDTASEMKRIFAYLGWSIDGALISKACEAAWGQFPPSHKFPVSVGAWFPVSSEALEVYEELCSYCGPIYAKILESSQPMDSAGMAQLAAQVLNAGLRDTKHFQGKAQLYAHKATTLELSAKGTDREVALLVGENDGFRSEVEQLRGQISHMQGEAAHLRSEVERLRAERDEVKNEAKFWQDKREDERTDLEYQARLAREQLEIEQRKVEQHKDALSGVYRTLSWRITKPLRMLRGS